MEMCNSLNILVTSGLDTSIKLWKISNDTQGNATVSYISELTDHSDVGAATIITTYTPSPHSSSSSSATPTLLLAVAKNSIFCYHVQSSNPSSTKLATVLEKLHSNCVIIRSIAYSASTLLAGLSDGSVSVWKVNLEDVTDDNIYRSADLMCSFVAHNSTPVTSLELDIDSSSRNDNYRNSSGGQTTFCTCGADGFVRQWCLKRKNQQVSNVADADGDGEADANTDIDADSVTDIESIANTESIVVAFELGSFKQHREPPSHYIEPEDRKAVEKKVAEVSERSKRPDPTRPDPTRPDPTRPDPTRPDPTRPDPTRPDPTRPDHN